MPLGLLYSWASLFRELASQCTGRKIRCVNVDIVFFRMLDDLFDLLTGYCSTSACDTICIWCRESHINRSCNTHRGLMNMSSSSRQGNARNINHPANLTCSGVKRDGRATAAIRVTWAGHFRRASQRGCEFSATIRGDAA